MNIDLANALAIFGFTGTILMAALGYLAKSLFSHFISKDFEAYKLKIKEVSELEKVKYSILQERRAQIFEKFYSLLAKFENSVKDLVAPFQPAGTPSEQKKATLAQTNGNNFINFYQQRKIYFDKNTCLIIDELIEKFRTIWIDFQYKDTIKDKNLWNSCWKTITEEIPVIRERIEDNFRQILGI